jgi:hypothetical protein
MSYFDESDQAGLLGMLGAAHLSREDHGGQLKEDCVFCNQFLKPQPQTDKPLSSYRFVIIDLGEPCEPNIQHVKR